MRDVEEWDTLSLRSIMALIAVLMMALASLSVVAVNHAADWHDGAPTVVTDKDVYLAGQTVRISVTCYIPAQFSSTGQCFFVVMNASGGAVYDLRSHVWVFWVLTSLMPPKTFSFDWNQKDDAGQQVPPGNYEIWGYEAGYQFYSSPPIAWNSTSISIVEEYDVDLVQGWNLFSLPLVASNYTSDSLGLPTRSVVVKWNSALQSYGGIFVVGVSPPSMAFELTEGEGYWIYAASACTVSVFGVPLTTTHYYEWVVPSGGGWVLVGFPKTSGIWHASDVAGWSDFPDAVRIVVCLDASAGVYKTYIAGMPLTDFGITPGLGYWVYLNQSVTVAYGP
jgi:hypothetical protein